jgi:hypothetical protein
MNSVFASVYACLWHLCLSACIRVLLQVVSEYDVVSLELATLPYEMEVAVRTFQPPSEAVEPVRVLWLRGHVVVAEGCQRLDAEIYVFLVFHTRQNVYDGLRPEAWDGCARWTSPFSL